MVLFYEAYICLTSNHSDDFQENTYDRLITGAVVLWDFCCFSGVALSRIFAHRVVYMTILS